MIKKFITLMLVVVCAVFNSGIVLAVEPKNDSELISIRRIDYVDEYGGKKTKYVDSDGNEVEKEHHSYNVSTNATIPSKYDSRSYNKVTSVKDQGDFGTCWAHAFCAAAESSLISQGYATKNNIDLSEAHLTWFSFNSKVAGSSLSVEKDDCYSSDPFDEGGNSYIATATVSKWSGFAKESDFPYNKTNSSKMKFSNDNRYVSNYELINTTHYWWDQEDLIKNAIMKYGAVTSSYFDDSDYMYRSSNGWCYYQDYAESTNHEITVVGWDDNFSRYNFAITPENNGAWLIKNSWGSDVYDSGYFWISYDDPSMVEFNQVVAKPTGSHDYAYAYDGTVCYTASSYSDSDIYMANVFTSDGSETVNGAGFTIENADECTVSLYTGLSNRSVPTSGTLRESKKIHCDAAGYYTVNFTNSYVLKNNETFAIVVKLTDSIYHDATINIEKNDSTYGSEFSYYANANESFVSDDGYTWDDTTKITNGYYNAGYKNVPIKAFTKIANQSFTVNFNANGGSVSPSSATGSSSQSVKLPTPTKSYAITYNANGGSSAPAKQNMSLKCLGWSTSSTATSATYSCGSSFYPTGNATLYAVWDKEATGNLSSTVPVRSGYKFIGWTVKAGDTSEVFEPNEGVKLSGNVTLYAAWQAVSQVRLGDVNIDGKINSNDALKVLQYSVGSITLSAEAKTNADVNKDNKVNSTDALKILQYTVGQITKF